MVRCLGVFLIYSMVISCNKEEYKPYDHPFVNIHFNNSDQARIRENRNETVEYFVYLSAKLQYEPTIVNFEIIAGNGLSEGIDYEIVNAERSVTLLGGVFQAPISIRWKSNPINREKDNSLTIRLTSNNRNFTIGLPGPDKKQSSLKITKF